MKCNLCKEASNFNEGLKGKNADKTRLMFLLNHSDLRVQEHLWGYDSAFAVSASGVILGKALSHCKLDFDDVYITNLVKCCFPRNREPTTQEYRNCVQVFNQQLADFQPRALVVFGNHPYYTLFCPDGGTDFSQSVGQFRTYQHVPTLISYHPSRIWALLNPVNQVTHFDSIKKFLTDNMRGVGIEPT